MTRIKICGITRVESGLVALEGGADFLGFVFYPPSHRSLEIGQAADLIRQLRSARPTGWRSVGVFVNEPITRILETVEGCQLDVAQFNGEETADYLSQVPVPVFKAVRLGGVAEPGSVPRRAAFGAERILLDASVPGRYGGTGVAYDWAAFCAAVRDGFLAGGLTPENVGEAVAAARPWGVDVSSGVERQGEKSLELIQSFIAAVRAADGARRKPGVDA